MKILVTGGCGFIGTNFIKYLIHKYPQYNIINLDKLTYAGNFYNLNDLADNSRYEFIKGDICNSSLVDKIVRDVDLVVHFAAESHVDRSIKSPESFVRTNILGTFVLLNACLINGKKRFHHISTDEVFGELGDEGKFNETSPYTPRSPYSASKASADHLVRAYFETYKLPVTISNCSNNYGPYQYPEKLLPLFITNLIDNQQIPVYGEGLNIRDWLHVNDHVRAIDLIIHQGSIGQTYCIGGEQEMRNIDIANMLVKEFQKSESIINFVEDRKGHDFRYAVDITKINKELGWKPKLSFKEGLRNTIDWYKRNREWWEPLKND